MSWYQQGVSNNSLKCAEALTGIYASCKDSAYHDGEKALFLASALVKKDAGNPVYMDLLAAAYARNLDFPNALKAASKAVALSSLEAAPHRRELRERYEQGMPCPPVASDVWIRQAAERENMWAVMQLAGWYGDELSENHEPVTARHWYEVAAQNGNTAALLKLGRMCSSGEGGEVDMKKAFWCFSEAVEAGNKKAYAPLARHVSGRQRNTAGSRKGQGVLRFSTCRVRRGKQQAECA
jgi:TPR repeat protein